MNICLIAVLGTGLLCSGDSKGVVTDTFCPMTREEVRKLAHLTNAEIAALKRPRKEAILSLRRKHARLCPAKK